MRTVKDQDKLNSQKLDIGIIIACSIILIISIFGGIHV
jgi:hypothetical protein